MVPHSTGGAASEKEHAAVFGEILLYFSNKRDCVTIYFSGKAKPSTSEGRTVNCAVTGALHLEEKLHQA